MDVERDRLLDAKVDVVHLGLRRLLRTRRVRERKIDLTDCGRLRLLRRRNGRERPLHTTARWEEQKRQQNRRAGRDERDGLPRKRSGGHFTKIAKPQLAKN